MKLFEWTITVRGDFEVTAAGVSGDDAQVAALDAAMEKTPVPIEDTLKNIVEQIVGDVARTVGIEGLTVEVRD